MFARLLGEQVGHWSLRPTDTATCTRRYLEATLVLESTYRTAGGTVTVTDNCPQHAARSERPRRADVCHILTASP